jgi:hypothetical protein
MVTPPSRRLLHPPDHTRKERLRPQHLSRRLRLGRTSWCRDDSVHSQSRREASSERPQKKCRGSCLAAEASQCDAQPSVDLPRPTSSRERQRTAPQISTSGEDTVQCCCERARSQKFDWGYERARWGRAPTLSNRQGCGAHGRRTAQCATTMRLRVLKQRGVSTGSMSLCARVVLGCWRNAMYSHTHPTTITSTTTTTDPSLYACQPCM